jgi:hypothetical protein
LRVIAEGVVLFGGLVAVDTHEHVPPTTDPPGPRHRPHPAVDVVLLTDSPTAEHPEDIDHGSLGLGEEGRGLGVRCRGWRGGEEGPPRSILAILGREIRSGPEEIDGIVQQGRVVPTTSQGRGR